MDFLLLRMKIIKCSIWKYFDNIFNFIRKGSKAWVGYVTCSMIIIKSASPRESVSSLCLLQDFTARLSFTLMQNGGLLLSLYPYNYSTLTSLLWIVYDSRGAEFFITFLCQLIFFQDRDWNSWVKWIQNSLYVGLTVDLTI